MADVKKTTPYDTPYKTYSSSLIEKFGHKVFRVGVDAGFSCPNRCGLKGTDGCVYCDSQGARAAYLRTEESGFRHDSDFEKGIDLEKGKALFRDESFYLDALTKKRIRDQIERGRNFIARRYKVEHFALYLQSFSNTFAPVEKLKEIYDFALSGYDWEGFIISTRPDCINDENLGLISTYNDKFWPVCVELGLQSANDEILKAMQRGHDVSCFLEACHKVKAHGLELCVHLLTGFPGEGKAQLDQTIAIVNQVHPSAIKIHNLNICSGTKLYDKYLQGEVTAPCMTRHIASTIYILRRIPSDIVIERLVCETPAHRLASPRAFADKNTFLRKLEAQMRQMGAIQGDLCEENGLNEV